MSFQSGAACLAEIDKLPRFGIEVYMNERIIKERLKIAVVTLANVDNTRKAEKMGLCRGTFADWKTALDVLRVTSPLEVVRQNYRMRALARRSAHEIPFEAPHLAEHAFLLNLLLLKPSQY